MSTINLAVLTAILVSPLGTFCLAQETVTTKDGRQVMLNPDGRWHIVTNTTETTSSSALQTLRLYLSAASLQDRTPFVMNPEIVEPLIKDRYRGKKWKVPQFEILTKMEPTPSQTGWVTIEVDVSHIYGIKGMSSKTMTYYLKKTSAGYRIDWESSEGFNPVTENEFRATKPVSPVRFRALATLDDYYNYEFSNAKNIAYCIKFSNGDGGFIGYGYIAKNTSVGQKLFQILEDGTSHPMVVELQYLPDAEHSHHFLISAVISFSGWSYNENEGGANQ